jgi:hypothetical protein
MASAPNPYNDPVYSSDYTGVYIDIEVVYDDEQINSESSDGETIVART